MTLPVGYLAGWLALLARQEPAAVGKPPAFGRYPAPAAYHGPTATPRLVRGTNAWFFRTRIREAATQPPNFAGHYVLATWGCGTECVGYAIIDRQTGAVYCDDRTVCCWGANQPDDFEPVRFRLDSRLVVFTGMLNEAGRSGPHYYQFAQGRLAPVR